MTKPREIPATTHNIEHKVNWIFYRSHDLGREMIFQFITDSHFSMMFTLLFLIFSARHHTGNACTKLETWPRIWWNANLTIPHAWKHVLIRSMNEKICYCNNLGRIKRLKRKFKAFILPTNISSQNRKQPIHVLKSQCSVKFNIYWN